jgi:hypothetical protein
MPHPQNPIRHCLLVKRWSGAEGRAALCSNADGTEAGHRIACELERLSVGMIICAEDWCVVIQTVTCSAVAAQMLAPMKGRRSNPRAARQPG